jgi:hypothetical protein
MCAVAKNMTHHLPITLLADYGMSSPFSIDIAIQMQTEEVN